MTEDAHRKTEFYKRWNMGHTQKNGWEPKDISISAKYEENKEPTHETMVSLARNAMDEAQAACDERNAREAEQARYTGKAQQS